MLGLWGDEWFGEVNCFKLVLVLMLSVFKECFYRFFIGLIIKSYLNEEFS